MYQSQSVHNDIVKRVKKLKRGAVFFPVAFSGMGTEGSIYVSLMRLEKEGFIIRLSRGIYLFPKTDPEIGVLRPSINSIAEALADRDKVRILPTGSMAQLQLGISTQVPMKAVYLTDGIPKKIKVGKGEIIFKKASPKKLAAKGKVSGLVITALDELGKDNVTNDVLKQIYKALRDEKPATIKEDAKVAPAWIRKLLLNYINNEEGNMTG
jgi:hypothetical protein